MAELTPRERLQPCVLDRLTDDKPEVKKESREKRVVSLQRYKDAVLRDLKMLLNSKAHPSFDTIHEFAEAAQSVLNYGVPNLYGTPISYVNAAEIGESIKLAILRFEPRILPESLSVRLTTKLDSENIRAVAFQIEGELWAQPTPDHLFIKTEVDLESGHHTLAGGAHG